MISFLCDTPPLAAKLFNKGNYKYNVKKITSNANKKPGLGGFLNFKITYGGAVIPENAVVGPSGRRSSIRSCGNPGWVI
jgi:hypothetical protein